LLEAIVVPIRPENCGALHYTCPLFTTLRVRWQIIKQTTGKSAEIRDDPCQSIHPGCFALQGQTVLSSKSCLPYPGRGEIFRQRVSFCLFYHINFNKTLCNNFNFIQISSYGLNGFGLTIFGGYRYKRLFDLQTAFSQGLSGEIQMRSKAQDDAQQGGRNMSGNAFCSHFSPLSPTSTIFSEPDTDHAPIHFVIRPDGAGPESIGNPIDF